MSASHLPSSKTVVSVAVVVAMGTFSLTSEAQADASPTDILALKLAWLVLPNGRVRDVRIVDEGRVPHSASSCVVHVVERMGFDPPARAGVVVEHTFQFAFARQDAGPPPVPPRR